MKTFSKQNTDITRGGRGGGDGGGGCGSGGGGQPWM